VIISNKSQGKSQNTKGDTDTSVPSPKGKAAKGEDSRKKEGLDALARLFEKQPVWKKQVDIIKALKKMGIKTNQATVSRWLKDIGAKKNDENQWALGKDSARKTNLLALHDAFNKTERYQSSFSAGVNVGVLKTKPHCNSLIAEKILWSFEGKVLSTSCPNETDIIIYYNTKDVESKGIEESGFEEILEEMCRPRKVRNENIQ